jgi:DNA replication and repair protein RecF
MITKVNLNNFRNFDKKDFKFSEKVTIIVGPNAAGKTNILESLYLLSSAKSFKAKVETEMINYSQDLARVNGQLLSGIELQLVITRGLIDIGAERPEKVARKKLSVNGVGKRMVDFAGNFKTTFFGPQDMDLVTESPSLRRRFLDSVLSQADREYRRCLLSYEKGVRQRNRLLWRIREEGVPRSQLLFWNTLLIKNGDYISKKRAEFIDYVNDQDDGDSSKDYSLFYDRSVISEGRLEQYSREEVAAATTLVGPHRDDFTFFEGKRNLASYGSRGEQRMGVLWVKMSELNFIEEVTSERPTLLLDDIFSELDHEHRGMVVKLSGRQQTIITTADQHYIDDITSADIISLK